MDFFYMDDLSEVVKFVIESNLNQKIINCSYKEKHKLSDIATMINNLLDHKVDIIVNDAKIGLNYFGDYNSLLYKDRYGVGYASNRP